MECSCCGVDHDPSGSCVLYASPFYVTIADYPKHFLTEGGTVMVYVVPCERYEQGELVLEFMKTTENMYGSAVSASLPTVEVHRAFHDLDVGCYYVYRWHPELLGAARKWRR